MVVAIWMIAGGVFGAGAGLAAVKRNRSAVGWWSLGVLLGPIGLALLFSKPRRIGERPAMF